MPQPAAPAADRHTALAIAIGEQLVVGFTARGLAGELAVYFDARVGMDVDVWLVLAENADATQLRALEVVAGVEDRFFDEAVLTLHFTHALHLTRHHVMSTPAYAGVMA